VLLDTFMFADGGAAKGGSNEKADDDGFVVPTCGGVATRARHRGAGLGSERRLGIGQRQLRQQWRRCFVGCVLRRVEWRGCGHIRSGKQRERWHGRQPVERRQQPECEPGDQRKSPLAGCGTADNAVWTKSGHLQRSVRSGEITS